MYLLVIETATAVCGIALFQNGKCVRIKEEELDRQHSEKLPLFYHELVSPKDFTLSDLDGIAVSIGPGSFTGLRIGLSYAKGLAFSAGLPIIPIPTLYTLTESPLVKSKEVRCILHSHKDWVYYQDFSFIEGNYRENSKPKSGKLEEVVNSVMKNQSIIQYGCDRLLARSNHLGEVVRVVPSARWVGKIAERTFREKKVEEYHQLEPEYISHFKISL